MNLDDSQKQQVAAWIGEGLQLAEIQHNLDSEFGVKLTYMEVRFLVDDLGLSVKDRDPAPALDSNLPPSPSPGSASSDDIDMAAPARDVPPNDQKEAVGSSGQVTVSLDQLARPGALISGKVKFSDGQSAEWQLDQFGRLGLVPQQEGYRPSAGDLQTFQSELQEELRKMGF